MKTTFKKTVALMLSLMIVFSAFSAAFAINASAETKVSVDNLEQAYDTALSYAIGNYEKAYAIVYKYAVATGYLDMAIGYIDIAISNIETGKVALAEFDVDAQYEDAKNALMTEFDIVAEILAKVKLLVTDDDMATIDGVYAEILARAKKLESYHDTIKDYAYVIGFAVESYVTEAYADAYQHVATLGHLSLAITAMDDAYAEIQKYAAKILEYPKLNAEIKEGLSAELAKLNKAYEENKNQIIEELDKLDVVTVKEMSAKLEAKQTELQNAIDEFVVACQGILEIGVEASFETIELAFDQITTVVSEMVAVISPEAAGFVDQFVAMAKSFIKAVPEYLTHIDYEVDKESNYVALGDNSASVEKFVEALATIIDEHNGNYKLTATDLTEAGSKINGLPAIIAANLEAIASADLISIGYGYEALAEETVNLLFDLIFKGETDIDYDIDLTEKVGPEVAAELEKVIADLYEILEAQGLNVTISDVPVADAVVIAAKYFAYYVAEYMVYMPQVVYNIHEINPDAIIMINAISNPIAGAGLAVTVPELGMAIELAFGDYFNYVTEIIYAETAAIAALNEKVVFVPTTEVESTFTGKTVSFNGNKEILQFVMNYEAAMEEMFNIEVTAEGAEYIAKMMLEALNITFKPGTLLGDVNGDGEINVADAIRILQYDSGLYTDIDETVADVNGDGDINVADAIFVLKYDSGLISEFPAAK